MANVGDKVIYHPGTNGRPFCDATITRVNDDGTVNIEYVHPVAPDVMASAESCQWGTGIYQVEGEGQTQVAEAAPDLQSLQTAHDALTSHAESLQTQLEERTAERDAALEAKKSAEGERKAALADVQRLTDELAVLTATKPDAPADDSAKKDTKAKS